MSFSLRVLDFLHYKICALVQRVDRGLGPALILSQEIDVPLEKSPVRFALARIPRDMSFFIDNAGWLPNIDYNPGF